MCVWLPRWPIQRLVGERPQLKDRALVLFAEAARGLQIVNCSDLATEWGISPGMPLAEARGLSSGPAKTGSMKSTAAPHGWPQNVSAQNVSPHNALLVEEYAPHTDRQVLEQLALACQTYAPLVGLEERDAPETLLLEITGCAPHFQGEEALALQLQNELLLDSYQTRIGVADTVGAAWAAAHYATSTARSTQIIPTGQQTSFLRPLPIQGLRLDLQILEVLEKLDVRTIQQVERLPRTTLPSRFGKQLQQRLDQAWGISHEPITAVRPRSAISANWNFEEPVTDPRAWELVSRELLNQILAELQPLRLGILELQSNYSGPADTFGFRLRLVQPAADQRHLWGLLQLEWERQQRGFEKSQTAPRCLTEGITSIQLVTMQSAPLRVRQQTLFELESGKKEKQAFRQLIERLGSRLGKPAVLRSHRVPDPQPELACEFQAWSECQEVPTEMPAEFPTDAWDDLLTRSRPLRLLSPPEPLQVLAVQPDGPPYRIWRQGSPLQIVNTWGPERITTGWWREHGIYRDYYRAETQGGPQFWIFRCLLTGNWFLHGAYE